MDKKQTQVIERLTYLRGMLVKYSHRWGENPSQRMYDWVNEYNDIKADNRPMWDLYCKMSLLSPQHDAYDTIAWHNFH